MTDGTTATDLGPVEDADMNAIRQVFEKAMNSIMSATHLAKIVADLETRVETLAKSTEDLRRQNAWLDESLTRIRGERDDALSREHQAKNELQTVQVRLDIVMKDNEHLVASNTSLHSQLAQVRAERDEYGLKHIQASEDLDKAHKALSTINDAVKAMLPQPQEHNDPVDLPAFLGKAHTEPMPEPYHKSEVRDDPEPADRDTINCDFDKPYRWDSTLSRYVNT